MNDKLGIGFIGCGEIAVATAKGLAMAQNARLAMAMDVSEALAKDMGEQYQAPFTTDVDKLLASPDVHAVYIATPHHLHAPMAIKAAQAGKHVMVEKPIATTVADGREMIAACRKAGVKLSVFLCMRYAPSIVKAKELVEKGAVGKIFAIRIQALGDKPAAYWTGGYSGRAKTDWRVSKEKSGGGILIMNAVHNIDAMRFITGLEATRVYAEYGTYATPVEVEDMIYVTLRYSNGAVGSIEGCSCVKGGLGDGQFRADRIYGADGQLVLTSPVKLFTTKTLDGIAPNKWQEVPQGPAVDTRTRYIEEFVDAVRAGKEPPITGEDGLAALAIIAAAYESGATCRPVSL